MNTKTGQNTLFANEVVDIERRCALRKIAVGVGVLAGISVLPEHWTSPIIGQVVLPAHAQTSGINGIFATNLQNHVGAAHANPVDSLVAAVENLVVSEAHAGIGPVANPVYICVTITGQNAMVVLGTIATSLLSYYSNSGKISNGVVVNILGTNYTVTFTSVTSTNVTVYITDGASFSGSATLTPTASCQGAV
jgi:hypothetical protein